MNYLNLFYILFISCFSTIQTTILQSGFSIVDDSMHVSLDNDDITEDVAEMISKDDPDKFLINHPGAHHASGLTAGDLGGASLSHDNNCQVNKTFIWCLPMDYNQEKHPFTFFHLVNKSLPWDYAFRFVIEEISNINDKAQTMSISMYFAVSWLEPRLQINKSATEWTEDRTGPLNEVNESPEILKYIWYPELEIYGLDTFGRQRVLKEMSGVRLNKNKTITYELGVRITISCRMDFNNYPLDAQTCQFQVGSYYDTHETVTCTSHYIYDEKRQRSLQHFQRIENLPARFTQVELPSGTYAACGIQVRLQRKQMQFLVQVYLPSFMFVVTSWVSFLIKPEVVPGRMGLLVTLFLVLINIFNSVREQAPISSRLNAIDLYLVVCIFLVFSALMEYAVILFLLKTRRKPLRTIDQGLKYLFDNRNGNNNAEASQPLRSPSPKRTRRTENNVQRTPAKDPGVTIGKQALVENIDAWAMWIAPPVFIFWNLCYWISYRPWTNRLVSEGTLLDYVLQKNM